MKYTILAAVALATAAGAVGTAQDGNEAQGSVGGGSQFEHLSVEWEPPRMGFDRGSLERSVRWLKISGRVLGEGVCGGAVPFAWDGDARVLIARQPGDTPSWREGIDPRDTLICQLTRPREGPELFFDEPDSDSKIGSDGRFHVRFSPMEIRRLVGQSGTYQVGLLVAEETLRWDFFKRGEGQLIDQSVGMLAINGPDPLPPGQAIINGAPSPLLRYYEPVGLIRAVNHLHGLGFEAAVRELRDFLAVAQHRFGGTHAPGAAPENPDLADRAKLFLILRLLFEPEDSASEPFPTFMPGMMMPRPSEPYPGELYPLVLVQDVPFFMAQWRIARSGPDPGPDHLLEWVVEHGKLRENPLRPPDDLLSALAEFDSLRDGVASLSPPGIAARRQVWLALQEATGLPAPEARFSVTVAAWQSFRDTAASLELYWDEESQSYRSRKREQEESQATATTLVSDGFLSRTPAHQGGAPDDTGAVSGHVYDVHGAPACGFEVFASCKGAGIWRARTRTDWEGAYEFPRLSVGKYALYAEGWFSFGPGPVQPGRGPHLGPAPPQSVEIEPGVALDGVDLQLSAAAAIEGLVTFVDGAPAARVEIQCRDLGPVSWLPVSRLRRTDRSGRYHLCGLDPAGEYWVRAIQAPYVSPWTLVQVRGGETAQAESVLALGAMVTVNILGTAKPTETCQVRIVTGNDITLAADRFQGTPVTLGPIAPGAYRIRALIRRGGEADVASVEQALVVSGAEEQAVTLRLR